MKTCSVCGQQFEKQFSFCPIEGEPLRESEEVRCDEYRPTLISDEHLAPRLIKELQFVANRFQRAWPDLKADPKTFVKIKFEQIKQSVAEPWARPNFRFGLIAALTIIACLILGVLVIEKRSRQFINNDDADELAVTTTIDFSTTPDSNSTTGIGAGDKGRVGFNKGRSEGSGPQPARSHGGGGGGDLAKLPQSGGRVPRPSVIPAPIPTTFARLPQSLPDAGIDIDPVLWKDLPLPNYGDPRSKSILPSNGPGNEGGVGTGQGPGVGEGHGPGFGPGRKGNIGGGDNGPGCCGSGGANGNNPNENPDRVYKVNEVSSRARLLLKPEPQYTEEARRSQITGTVILGVVFARDGTVSNIRAVQTLCCGLTEKAIAAARQIRFQPATRNGQPVSTYMQLEYNFNLY